jgi:hypothetical protein
MIPWLDLIPAHEEHAVIVAGGPSIKDSLDEIRWRQSEGQTVISCNGATAYLIENGIIPNHQIIIDAQPNNARFVVTFIPAFLASQCDPNVFNSAKDTTLFHLNTTDILDSIPINGKPLHLISSGTTVGLAAMAVAYTQGFRKIHLYGYDSSYADTHHAYSQPENDADQVVDAVAAGRSFKCAPWMVKQVQQFQELALQLIEDGVIITVAGDGLLPWVAKHM